MVGTKFHMLPFIDHCNSFTVGMTVQYVIFSRFIALYFIIFVSSVLLLRSKLTIVEIFYVSFIKIIT